MVKLEEINRSDFLQENFSFIIGEYATYNHYYKIVINHNNTKCKIGLQIEYSGVEPQIDIFKNSILVGAGNKLLIYNLSGELIQSYLFEPAFYEFIIFDNTVLVIGELNILLLDDLLNLVWNRGFNEIIVKYRIDNYNIIIEDYAKNETSLNLFNGKKNY